MMFVVKTWQQLEAAMENNAQEVMIVGKRAPEILETINRPALEAEDALYPIFSRLNNNFELLEITDNNHTVEGIFIQKPVMATL